MWPEALSAFFGSYDLGNLAAGSLIKLRHQRSRAEATQIDQCGSKEGMSNRAHSPHLLPLPPDSDIGSVRPAAFVRSLREWGHQVTVISSALPLIESGPEPDVVRPGWFDLGTSSQFDPQGRHQRRSQYPPPLIRPGPRSKRSLDRLAAINPHARQPTKTCCSGG